LCPLAQFCRKNLQLRVESNIWSIWDQRSMVCGHPTIAGNPYVGHYNSGCPIESYDNHEKVVYQRPCIKTMASSKRRLFQWALEPKVRVMDRFSPDPLDGSKTC
jgi:hypothetical protein